MNQPHLYELQQRYAKMSPEEFADIRREYLTEEAVTSYDQEVNRRNTPKWKEAEYKYYQELSHSDSIEREYNKRLRKVARLWQTVLSILLVISFLVFRPQLTPSNQAVCVNLRCYNTWDEYLRTSIREEAIEAGLPEPSEYEIEKMIEEHHDAAQRSQDIGETIFVFSISGVLGGLGAFLGWIVARLTTRKSGSSQQNRLGVKGPWES